MKDRIPTTDLIASLQQGHDAATDLYDRFLGRAREIAQNRLGAQLKGRRTASTIAHEALASCMKNTQKMRKSLDGDDFHRLLRKHINMTFAEAARHESRSRRDKASEESVNAPTAEGARIERPEVAVASEELAVELVKCINEEPTEKRRMMCLLGILNGYNGNQISEILASLETDDASDASGDSEESYSIRTIQKIVQRRKAIIYNRFGLDET
ncbi:ECF-type sigma factor [Aeoliella sp.]|uniref:ECF-type sigma factor n=1 Tax=Aeoliella sp. TaxID=2795800 RepID=UPI003CCC1FD1